MKIAIISHYTQIPGTTHQLIRYLEKKVVPFVILLLPLSETLPCKIIRMDRNKKEELSCGNLGIAKYLSGLACISNILLRENCSLFIGVNPFNAFIGWILKKIFFKRWIVIFYSVDYSPERFSKILLNKFYHLLDYLAVKTSDFIWCSSKRIFNIRKNQKSGKKRVLYVPNGSWIRNIEDTQKEETKNNVITFVFAGYLGEQYDLDVFICEVNKKENFKFHIFGDGPRKRKLDTISSRNIIFHGTIPNEVLLKKFKTKKWIGIAPYNNRISHVYFGSSLKVIEYLSCGLPVIVSTVVEIAEDIKRNKCGWVYSDIAQLKDVLKEIETSISKEYDKLSRNALRFSKNFYWKKIYDQAFSDTFCVLRQENHRREE